MYLVDFDASALDGFADLLVLLQVPVRHLPLLESVDHGVLGSDLLHGLG